VYHRSYALWHLLRHPLPEAVRGATEHGTFLRDWIAGRRPEGVPPGIGARAGLLRPARGLGGLALDPRVRD
jgi:hypothetical protein